MVTKASRRETYRCQSCDAEVARWVGRCPECQEWDSLRAVTPRLGPAKRPGARSPRSSALPIGQVTSVAVTPRPTGVAEFDRVLGGGLVPGAVILLAGEPGIGKSTLLLQVAHRSAATAGRALVVTGEESAGQVRLRSQRLGADHADLYLAAETDLSAILSLVAEVQPSLLVIDSVQTMADPEEGGVPAGVTQVRAVASALTDAAKRNNITTVLVGHVTKDGQTAGPRTLEHVVDVVLSFEGEEQSPLRLVRATKNRFGTVDEVGCFRMTEEGLVGVEDPSELFVSRHEGPVPGTCLSATLQGRRPIMAEVQALVGSPGDGPARRAVSGLDTARVAMMAAVAQRHAAVDVTGRDLYAATVGGLRVTEPAIDLGIVVALASAARSRPLPTGVAAVGEVGLAGEVRGVTELRRRVEEGARQGVTTFLVPHTPQDLPSGVRCVPVRTVAEAVQHAFRLHVVPASAGH